MRYSLMLLVLLAGCGCAEERTLWEAICYVESSNNPEAYNESEQAAGVAQIRPICLRDCNRIVGYPRWTMGDRYCPVKAEQMFWVYTNHYIRHYRLEDTPENRARIWNGGPTGWKKQATIKYWVKIQNAMGGK